MTLDRALLESELNQTYFPANFSIAGSLSNYALHLLDTVDSTNSIAWSLLKAQPSQNVAVIAQRQTAGRGQRGHQWQSESGGLYLSLGIHLDLPVSRALLLTLTSAWGIAIALRHQQIPVKLKWLNDLVVDGRKLGGILTESRIRQGRIYQAVIGVGINWTNAVPETGISLQRICQEQQIPPIDRLETLGAIVIQGISISLTHWQQQDIAAFLPAYESLLMNLGQSVVYQNIPGQVLGITPTGELRVSLQPGSSEAIPQGCGQRCPVEVCLKPGEVGLGYGEQGSGRVGGRE